MRKTIFVLLILLTAVCVILLYTEQEGFHNCYSQMSIKTLTTIASVLVVVCIITSFILWNWDYLGKVPTGKILYDMALLRQT